MADNNTTSGGETNAQRSEGESEGVRGQVKDTEATNQQTRLQGVHQAWKQALDRRTLAADHGGTQEGRRYYRVGVERLLIEIESVADRANAHGAWQKADLGTLTWPVPDEIQAAYDRRNVRILDASRDPEPIRKAVIGLETILNTDWPVSRTWKLTVASGHGQRKPLVATTTLEPTMDVLDKAIRKLRTLLGEVGLDLELGGSYRAIGGDDAL